jgi:hypothetical protein
MLLKIEIKTEVDASDFFEAAGHQEKVEAFLQTFRRDYPDAVLEIRERRLRGHGAARPEPRRKRRSGRVAAYSDE